MQVVGTLFVADSPPWHCRQFAMPGISRSLASFDFFASWQSTQSIVACFWCVKCDFAYQMPATRTGATSKVCVSAFDVTVWHVEHAEPVNRFSTAWRAFSRAQ